MSIKTPALQVEQPHPDPRLASLLPSDIALRCRALPIAADGKRITVAMAHPDDLAARQAVVDSLGPDTCVVQANPQEMERMLKELWPSGINPTLHLMCWSSNEAVTDDLESYARSLTRLLDARFTSVKVTKT